MSGRRARAAAAAAALLLGALRTLSAAAPRRVEVSKDFAVSLEGGAITVEARPLEGETPVQFARRLARDEATAQRILELPGALTGRGATLSWGALSLESRRAAVQALFPSDVRATAAWLHIAVEEESLASLAEWFTGDAARAADLAKENALPGGVVPPGATVRIPAEYLVPPFRDAEPVPETEPPNLVFGEDAKGRFATYRLRKGEALYSAVVVRFTGRVDAADVNDLALRLAERSGIADVHAIPVGYPVKIPIEFLADEFLPKEDPRSIARAREKAETAQFSRPEVARGLEGVRVILDAGHGGRDTGTTHGGLWESTYVYDVTCRLRRILSERTHAEVLMTTKDGTIGWSVPDQDRLRPRRGQVLLTRPPYDLEDPAVGVNLRWYLANSLLRRPSSDGRKIQPEKTVFLSLHADSLHPSLRGAMVYVPGERYLRDRYGKTGAAYASYREVKEEPVVSFNKKERVASEGASTTLAAGLVAALRDAGLPVHSFSPVRTHVIRGGREWVPAVLRYNRVPNRALVELANLGNDEDRALIVTRAYRQALAESLASGLVAFFGGPPPEIYGPVPPPFGVRAAPEPAPKPAPRKTAKKKR
ncbi:MAG TPA: N-acetylmuramoyl-L-alanine amidase [Thermoanaerobaculia bacterium]|nr:N-acetylmuramoyl-L-alanine amidase [Thermoanaerobaculia bacterium]